MYSLLIKNHGVYKSCYVGSLEDKCTIKNTTRTDLNSNNSVYLKTPMGYPVALSEPDNAESRTKHDY